MKFVVTVAASVILAGFLALYVARDQLRQVSGAPEQATILVVGDRAGTCVPLVARPIVRAHSGDVIEWQPVELPGCEGQGRFGVAARDGKGAELFDPPLQGKGSGAAKRVRVLEKAHPGDVVHYTIRLDNGREQDSRIEIW